MRNMKVVLAAIGFALLAGACGGEASTEPEASSEEISAQEVRSVLTEANQAARAYGRDHLGHYLRMTRGKLVLAGLELPEDITLTVKTDHVGYCLRATSTSLSGTHAWAVATANPKTDAPSPNDTCPKGRY